MHLRLICYYEHYMPSWLKWVLPGDLMCCLLVEVGEGHLMLFLLVDVRHLRDDWLGFSEGFIVCVCWFTIGHLFFSWWLTWSIIGWCIFVSRLHSETHKFLLTGRGWIPKKYSPSKASFHKHGNQTLNEEELVSCNWKPQKMKTWKWIRSSKDLKEVEIKLEGMKISGCVEAEWSTWRQDKSRCRLKGIRAKVHNLKLLEFPTCPTRKNHFTWFAMIVMRVSTSISGIHRTNGGFTYNYMKTIEIGQVACGYKYSIHGV